MREEREEGVAGREGGRSCGKRERKELREEREEGVAGREKGRSCWRRRGRIRGGGARAPVTACGRLWGRLVLAEREGGAGGAGRKKGL